MKTVTRPRSVPSARRFLLLGLLLLLGSLGGRALAQDLSSAVQLRLEMFVVSEVDSQEQYTPSITARAGETVEYRIVAVNHAQETLQAGTVIITVPIPSDTTYLQNSAVPVSDEVMVEFRADGSVFMSPTGFAVGNG